MNGHAYGDHKLVDARNMLARVNEEPLPVQRDALDLSGGVSDANGFAGSRSWDPIEPRRPEA